MAAPQFIEHHEHQQHLPFREWLESYRHGRLPPYGQNQGTVTAYVNHSRWVIDCVEGCGWAVVASDHDRFFICPGCGNPQNGGQWYRVVYPPQKERIERALLKRESQHRNWLIKETPENVEAENVARGLG